jgi:hypothetical protein
MLAMPRLPAVRGDGLAGAYGAAKVEAFQLRANDGGDVGDAGTLKPLADARRMRGTARQTSSVAGVRAPTRL